MNFIEEKKVQKIILNSSSSSLFLQGVSLPLRKKNTNKRPMLLFCQLFHSYIVEVTADVQGTIQFQTSCSDVVIRLTILDLEEEVASYTGKGHVVIPVYCFLSGQGRPLVIQCVLEVVNTTFSCLILQLGVSANTSINPIPCVLLQHAADLSLLRQWRPCLQHVAQNEVELMGSCRNTKNQRWHWVSGWYSVLVCRLRWFRRGQAGAETHSGQRSQGCRPLPTESWEIRLLVWGADDSHGDHGITDNCLCMICCYSSPDTHSHTKATRLSFTSPTSYPPVFISLFFHHTNTHNAFHCMLVYTHKFTHPHTCSRSGRICGERESEVVLLLSDSLSGCSDLCMIYESLYCLKALCLTCCHLFVYCQIT